MHYGREANGTRALVTWRDVAWWLLLDATCGALLLARLAQFGGWDVTCWDTIGIAVVVGWPQRYCWLLRQ